MSTFIFGLTPNHGRKPIIGLSDPERRVLQELAHGLRPIEIATKVNRSINTINDHANNAVTKLEAKTKAHAVHIATKQGLIE